MIQEPTLAERLAGMPGAPVEEQPLRVADALSGMPGAMEERGLPRLEVAPLPGAQWLSFLSPQQILGPMRSSVDPGTLGLDEWPLIQNLRRRERVPRVRWGDAQIFDGTAPNKLSTKIAAMTNPQFRGGAYDPGTGIIYLAITDDTYTKIWFYSPSNDGWYEMTENAGQYGQSRFPHNDRDVYFAIVRETGFFGTLPFSNITPRNHIVALIDHPTELPRVAGVKDDANVRFAKVKNIPAPQPERCWSWAKPLEWYDITAIGAGSVYSSGADVVATRQGAADTQYAQIVYKTTPPALNDRAGFKNLTETIVAGSMQEIHIVYECTDPYPWESLAFDLWDGAAWVTLYDPSSSPTFAYPKVHVIDDRYRFVALLVDKSVFSNPAATYTGFAVRWRGTVAPSADQTLKIYMVGSALGRPGGATFAVSFLHSVSRAESPRTICQDKGGIPIFKVGGTKINGLKYPVFDDCVYTYQVFANQLAGAVITDADMPGTDYLLTYCKDFGGTDYRLLADYGSGNYASAHQIVAVYGGGAWTRPTGIATPNYGEPANPLDNEYRSRMVINNPTLARNAPDDVHEVLPPGSGLYVLNQRVLVVQPSLTNGYNRERSVAMSEATNPFRFRFDIRRKSGNFDPLSATVATFGDETVRGMAVISGGGIGADSAFVGTDRGLWALSSNTSYQLSVPQKVSQYGLIAPRTMAVYKSSVLYVDTDRNIRIVGSDQPLSYQAVEDRLRAVPAGRISKMVAGVIDDFYYLAITPSGGTANTEVLVFDFQQGAWSLDKYSTLAPAGWLPLHVSGVQTLTYASGTGQLYEKAKVGQTTDAGTSIEMALTTREIRVPAGRVLVGPVACMLDKQTAPKFLSVRRYTKGASAAPVESFIDCSGAAGESVIHRYDAQSILGAPETIGALDIGIRIDLRGYLLGGTKIYEFGAEVQPIAFGGITAGDVP